MSFPRLPPPDLVRDRAHEVQREFERELETGAELRAADPPKPHPLKGAARKLLGRADDASPAAAPESDTDRYPPLAGL